MNSNLRYISFILLISSGLITVGCNTVRKLEKTEKEKKILSEAEKSEYQYALTEATKYKMFGNYRQAASLYEKCIKVNEFSDVAHYQLGTIDMITGNLESAKMHTKEAIEINEKNFWYMMQLAQIYNIEKQLDSLKQLYQVIIQYWPEKVEIRYDLARIFVEDGNNEQALRILNKIEREYGISEPVSLLKEQIFVKEGKYEIAIEELQKLIDLIPDEVRFLGIMAELYNSIGRNEEAREIYNTIFEMEPENTLALLSFSEFLRDIGEEEKQFETLGKIFRKEDMPLDQKLQVLVDYLTDQNKFEEQKVKIGELIDILLENYPDNYKVRTAYADYLVKLDRYKEALKEYEYVLSIEKSNYFIWEQKLFIENLLENNEELYNKSGEAIKLFPDKPVLYLLRGNAAMRLDKINEAIKILEQGLEKVKNNNALILQFYTYLAESCQSAGNNVKSDEYFELALEMDPDNLLIMNNYSYYLSLRGEKLDYAEKISKKTIEAEPENSTYLDTYAWIMYKVGNYRKAREYIEKAINFGGKENPEILEHYGDILDMQGYKREALKYWRLSLEKGNVGNGIVEKIKRAEKND